MTIEVTDVNDEVPEFVTPDETFYGSVKEDDAPGTYVATVRAEDKDLDLGGEVAYEIFFVKLIPCLDYVLFKSANSLQCSATPSKVWGLSFAMDRIF